LGRRETKGVRPAWPLGWLSRRTPKSISPKPLSWYEARQVGVGEEFLGSLDACIERIRRQPLIYPFVHEAYRRGLIRRFRYAVFFEYTEPTITVDAMFHTSRDPEKWRQRLP
jgi:plasmid stabilization system protein ParE